MIGEYYAAESYLANSARHLNGTHAAAAVVFGTLSSFTLMSSGAITVRANVVGDSVPTTATSPYSGRGPPLRTPEASMPVSQARSGTSKCAVPRQLQWASLVVIY